MPFWPLCCESKVILSKKFRTGHPSWSVHMGKINDDDDDDDDDDDG